MITKRALEIHTLRRNMSDITAILKGVIDDQKKSAELGSEMAKGLAQVMLQVLTMDMRLRIIEEHLGVKRGEAEKMSPLDSAKTPEGYR